MRARMSKARVDVMGGKDVSLTGSEHGSVFREQRLIGVQWRDVYDLDAFPVRGDSYGSR